MAAILGSGEHRYRVGDDGERSVGSDGLAQVIGIMRCIGHDDIVRQSLDQDGSLRVSPLWPAVSVNPTGHPKARTAMCTFVLKPPSA